MQSDEYKLYKIWQEALEYKYRAHKEGLKEQFNKSTWTNWLSRFPSNHDATNELFLKCIEKAQRGEIFFTTSPPVPFVSSEDAFF